MRFRIDRSARRRLAVAFGALLLCGATVVLPVAASTAAGAAPAAPPPGSAPLFLPDPNVGGGGGITEIPAGGGSPIPVAAAGVQYPTAIAAAADGTLYVTQLTGTTPSVAKIVDGTLTTVTTAVNTPFGIAVDEAGTIYVADTGDNQVLRIDGQTGAATTVGQGLSGPWGVTVDGQGRVLIADTGNNRVVAVADGVQSTLDLGSLSHPSGVAVDQAGTVYVADTGNGRVVVVPTTGSPSSISSPNFESVVKVGLDGQGNVYIADIQTGTWKAPADNGAVVQVSGTSAYDLALPPIPGPVTDVSAVASDQMASVSFDTTGDVTGSTYTVTALDQTDAANGGQVVDSTAGGPVALSGLTNGDAYTFAVTVTNPAGATSVASSPSAAVTPQAAQVSDPQQVVAAADGTGQLSDGNSAASGMSFATQALIGLGVLTAAGAAVVAMRRRPRDARRATTDRSSTEHQVEVGDDPRTQEQPSR